jgi:hypothetical protein
MSDDDKILMGLSVRHGPAPFPSKRFFCVRCGEQIWISMPMAPGVMKGEFRPWCEPCVVRADGEGQVSGWHLDAEQEGQLDALGLLDFCRSVVDGMNERGKR